MLTRRALFQATAAAGITAAVGPEVVRGSLPAEFFAASAGAMVASPSAFTFADLLRAEATLNAANVPRFTEHFGPLRFHASEEERRQRVAQP
jgi:hypothetical protein